MAPDLVDHSDPDRAPGGRCVDCPDPEFTIEILVVAVAPDAAAAERIARDVRDAALRTNCRIRDGRIDNVIIADVRTDDE